MVTFLTELDISPVGPKRWKVVRPLECDTPFGRIVVPAGFLTDGASVPRPVWALFPPFDGDYDAAAVLHDYAYQHAVAIGLCRSQCDTLLNEGMKATGTSSWKRLTIYSAVRSGGHFAWQADRKAEK